MAAKLVIVVACLAACSAGPVDDAAFRDGRAYSIGQAYNNDGGASVATANVVGDNAQAYGSTSGSQLARDGLAYPGQNIAFAQTYGAQEIPSYGSKTVAQAHNGVYYPVPAPVKAITYEQNFAAPAEGNYQTLGAIEAYSSAVKSDASEKSTSSVINNGQGVAESSANTGDGSYRTTLTNAKTTGNYGHADSVAQSGYKSANSAAKSQGDASASSTANTNGAVYPVVPSAPITSPQEYVPSVLPVYKTTYVPAVPSSAITNAQVFGSGTAASSAKVNQGRSIGWRFGTLYDNAESAHAQANSRGSGSAESQANTQGSGIAKSQANSNGYGSANANADVNSGYGAVRYTPNTYDGSATSFANSNNYGNAKSAANVHQGYYGGSRTSTNAQTQGFGSASSSARGQPVSTAYRVANTQANSFGSGYARANAQTV